MTMVHVDGEFEAIHVQLAAVGLGLNICSANEHVLEVERFIRTVKEQACCIYNTVLFQKFQALLIKEVVTTCILWLNMFPPHDGMSSMLSPCVLMAGFTLDYHQHCQLEFGAYTQTHEEHDNSMQLQMTGAIVLCPTGNHQGGYYFLSLTSSHWLTQNQWTTLLMPQDIIDHVNTLGQCSHAIGPLTFTWHDGTPILDDTKDEDDNNSNYAPSELANDSDDDLIAAGVDESDNDNDNDNDSDEEGSNNGWPKVDDNDNEDGAPNFEGSSDVEDGAQDYEG